MRATTKTTEPIRFIVDVSPNKYNADTLDAVVYPVIIEEGKIRNCSWSSLGDRGAEYADLKITGRLWRDSLDTGFYYGYDDALEYCEIFTINLRRAESIVKTLRRLNKKMEGIQEKFGRPTDFAAFLGYLAQAMGADDNRPFARITAPGSSYDTSSVRWMDVDDLRSHFIGKIRDWKGTD